MLALNKIKLRASIYFSAFNEKTPSVATSHMLAVNVKYKEQKLLSAYLHLTASFMFYVAVDLMLYPKKVFSIKPNLSSAITAEIIASSEKRAALSSDHFLN